MVTFDFELETRETERMQSIRPEAWFTQVAFKNVTSPRHPEAADLDANHNLKAKMLLPWIRTAVKGKRVLDLFCANGAFSFEAARAGASEVVGVEFSGDRIDCAKFVASTLTGRVNHSIPQFVVADVYHLRRLVDKPFDELPMLRRDFPELRGDAVPLRRLRGRTDAHHLDFRGEWRPAHGQA